jgi:hypothetical protein
MHTGLNESGGFCPRFVDRNISNISTDICFYRLLEYRRFSAGENLVESEPVTGK